MKFLVLALSLSFSGTAFAAGDLCSNFAQYFAIREYKNEMGTVQGSEGIGYSAELVKVQGAERTFEVAINDNNEDGDAWTVTYEVVVKKNTENQKCSLVSIENLGTDDDSVIDEP